MQSDLNFFLEVAIKASIEAGKAILHIYENDDFEIQLKSDESPLTKADLKSNSIIISYLKDTPFALLSEEERQIPYSQRAEDHKLWIVDPLDGTKEFINRNGDFTVNIALVADGIPLLGVVYAPVTKELYFAAENIGSFKAMLNTDPLPALTDLMAQGILLPIENNTSELTIVASRSHLTKETEQFIDNIKERFEHIEILSRGSSLKLCMVAEGIADCYPRFAPTMEWDTAAGHAICKYSGAQVTDWTTQEEMRYNKENLLNNWFLVHRGLL